ncbi:major facilitator superfamily domain-containing protein [Gymnopilus junonius]|uniref:Major facilitator superfamily domain-containing protein n=1 Tax=Gymnopilus junonius TaxID=109634 RepID=A0A9P5TKE5_GYMJU|nr:major facilitator superfamily domain-containing protein [Gymnopilus junonius]
MSPSAKKEPQTAIAGFIDISPAARAAPEGLEVLASFPVSLKAVLLLVFCFAQFLDAFNNSSFFAAAPPISLQLHINNSNSVWLVSAYQLTFASLLLTSGRLSDIYNPKYIFCGGTLLMSFCALGARFVRTQIPLIILRALMGVGGALNVPSAMAMIIHTFPNATSQSKALSVFASSGAIGNVIGLIIGASLTTFASWPWVLYFSTILSFVLATLSSIVLRPVTMTWKSKKYGRFKRLDIFGVSILTVALILFVFSVTSGSADGWRTLKVILTLVLSIILVVIFFTWEARLPETLAAVPNSTWRIENFGILILVSLHPFMWWTSVQLLFSWYWQNVFGWSTIGVAIRFRAFPGFFVGTTGMTLVFTTTNVALFAYTPPKMAGIVGAIFTCALQLGSAAGAAIITSIQTSVEQNNGGPDGFQGRAAGFWFLFTFSAIVALTVLLFMKSARPVAVVERDDVDEIATSNEKK